jgi:hypothetical protein
MPSLISRLRQLHLLPSPESKSPEQPLQLLSDADAACQRIAIRGLFVIGAARTGTTILQNALNDSADVFLFGEPGFHRDPGSADFAVRYNSMHRA